MDFIVGTFRSPTLYTLRFTPPSTVKVLATSAAAGGSSWLSLSQCGNYLYATVWSEPPKIAAYRIHRSSGYPPRLELINTAQVRNLSGYTACNATHVFTVGGATGEVFTIKTDGGIGELVQELEFRIDGHADDGAREGVAHGNFGGLRHGAHSIDLSPDGRMTWVADIGHNCIWSFEIPTDTTLRTAKDGSIEVLKLVEKKISARTGDGPRHCWPHPNGKVLYCLQEHSCMVDVFALQADGKLEHKQGVRIIPEGKDPKKYWADEVRLSRVDGDKLKHLFASTRGLEVETKGYVAAFKLDGDGMIAGDVLDIFETATSGGLANAVEPAPGTARDGDDEYMALTDSEQGFVSILAFDGKKIRKVARVQLKDEQGQIEQAATAVWLPV